MNLNSIPRTVAELYTGKYNFTSDDCTYDMFKEKTENQGIFLSDGEKVKVYSPIESSISSNKLYIVVFLLILIISVINIILSLRYWVDSMRKEIGIRKCLGASNLSVLGLLIKKLSKYILLACLVGSVIYGIAIFLIQASFSFSLFTLGFVLMALILTTFIGILPIIYKVVRIQPVEMMR